MNKYKKLIGNSFVFAIGNFGSKFINIIMVPLYTIYLSTENYGTIDLITTLISLLLPIFSLCVYESILRFSMDNDIDKQIVFTNSILIQILLGIVSIILYPLLLLTSLKEYSALIFLLLILQLFQILFSQFTRGIGKVTTYSINGIIMTLIVAGSNIALIAKFNMGVVGYLYSLLISNAVSIVYLSFKTNIVEYINFNKIDTSFIKESLQFALPLIPNTLMWWLLNSSSRFFIVYFLGTSANGLFAVSNKVPLVLTSVIAIFNQAWQMSAIEEYNSKDKNVFYNRVYISFISFLFLSTSAIFIILVPLFQNFIGKTFYESWKYVPFLLIGVIFSSFSTFLGTNYVAAKKTKGLIITSFYCGVINSVLNIILIPILGINGASISSMVSFFALWIMRIKDTSEFVEIYTPKKKMVVNTVIILTQALLLYLFSGNTSFIIQGICFALLLFINKEFLISMLKNTIKIMR